MARQASVLGGGTVTLDAVAFEARFNMPLVHETVRAELNARRRGTAATKTRGEVSRRRRQALAAEGHRAGSRRVLALAAMGRRRHRVRPVAAQLHGQGQPQGAPRGVRAARCRCTPSASRWRCSTPGRSTLRRPARRRICSTTGAPTGHTLVLLSAEEADAGKSFRNIFDVDVMPASDAGVADIVGAASMLVSQAALPELIARAAGASDTTDEEAGS